MAVGAGSDSSQLVTVTFLFTDIEGSTRLLARVGDDYAELLETHRRLLRVGFALHDGVEVDTQGDSFFVSFATPSQAVAAAVAGQVGVASHPWPDGRPVRVRMGLHTGEASLVDGDYVGMEVHRAARIAAAAHGGQVLVSDTTAAFLRFASPATVGLRDLGEFELKDLPYRQRLFQLDVAGLPREFPPPRARRITGNLPSTRDEFVGRDDARGGLRARVIAGHVTTLVGFGGVGKTRLAVETARELAAEFDDGVWFVDLAWAGDVGAVAQLVATVLSIRAQEGMSTAEAVIDWLRERRMLLILDNCEHVVDAAAELVAAITTDCPEVRVLATSRQRLGLPGEAVESVAPLAPECGGSELFLLRAAAGDRGAGMVDRDPETIRRIVTRLEGNPLAIELAAARARTLGVSEVFKRLEDRFRFLRGNARGVAARHQTLEATVDWSYQLLTISERALFVRLSVFDGGFTLAGAEAVAAATDADLESFDAVDALSALVDKSMVVVHRTDGGTRFEILETLRAYGRARLDHQQQSRVRELHLQHFVNVARSAHATYRGPGEALGAVVFAAEWDNFRGVGLGDRLR